MNEFERIYELSFEKLQTYYNLVDHIRNANYNQVIFEKNNDGVIVSLHHQIGKNKRIYECQFDNNEMLQFIYIVFDNERELVFDREYELTLKKAVYISENYISCESDAI